MLDCKICSSKFVDEIEDKKYPTIDDLLEWGITESQYTYHQSGHTFLFKPKFYICKPICKPTSRKIRICKYCGMQIYNNSIYGYCNWDCLKEHNPSLYLEKRNLNGSYKHRSKNYFNKYGLINEPDNEAETIFLFTKIHKQLGFKFIKTT